MTNPKKTAEQLAEEHWAWLESVLYQEKQLEKKLYISGFIHGFKHGKEVRRENEM